jgi:transcriptional regulator with XRE-family HTH domain
MGRRESPLARDGSPTRELAFWLRDLRNRSGLTYEQLARRSSFSTSTLQESLSGRRIPTRQVTLAIVAACGGDSVAWHSYWTQVRRAVDQDAPDGLEVSLVPPWAANPQPQAAPESVTDLSGERADLNAEQQQASANSRLSPLRMAWLTGSALTATAATIAVVLLVGPGATTHQPTAQLGSPKRPPRIGQGYSGTSQRRTYQEEEYNRNGAATFRFLNASGPGQPLEFKEFIQVSCKIYSPGLRSSRPDGYWYRIYSLPWNDNYYAVANTFLNGDRPNGPYTHNVDWSVPNCIKTGSR